MFFDLFDLQRNWRNKKPLTLLNAHFDKFSLFAGIGVQRLWYYFIQPSYLSWKSSNCWTQIWQQQKIIISNVLEHFIDIDHGCNSKLTAKHIHYTYCEFFFSFSFFLSTHNSNLVIKHISVCISYMKHLIAKRNATLILPLIWLQTYSV